MERTCQCEHIIKQLTHNVTVGHFHCCRHNFSPEKKPDIKYSIL